MFTDSPRFLTMKRAIILLLFMLQGWCMAGWVDPAHVTGIVIKLSPIEGVEMGPFPLLVGESTVASVSLTLDDGTILVVPPQEVTLSSQNTNVLQTGPGLQITAVGYGSTSVYFNFWWWIWEVHLTAVMPPARIVHRYSFDSNAVPGLVMDSIGTAHGWLTNDLAVGSMPIITNGEAVFNGQGGYVGLPTGIASSFTNLSLAVWITPAWGCVPARVLDFAVVSNNPPVRAGGLALGTDRIVLRGMWGSMTQEVGMVWGEFEQGCPRGLLAGTVAPSLGFIGSVVYGEGQLYTNLPALKLLADMDNRIGGSLEPGLSFTGRVAEVRMYEGILNENDVAVMRYAGPDRLVSTFGELRRVRFSLNPALVELSNSQPATVQVFGDFTGSTNVDLLETGLYSLSVPEFSQNVLALQGSNQVRVIGLPGTAILYVNSLSKQMAIAGMSVPVAGPRQLKLALPGTTFSVRDLPVGLTVAGDFLYATNIDLTTHSLTRFTVSDTNVAQLLPGPKLEFLKAGTAWIAASFEGSPQATTAVQITVTNPPGFAGSFPRLQYRWNFSDSAGGYDLVRHALLIGLSIPACLANGMYAGPYGPGPSPEGTFAHLNDYSSFFDMGYGLMTLTNCTLEMWVRCHYPRVTQRLFNLFQTADPYGGPGICHGWGQDLVGNIMLAPISSTGSGGVLAVFSPANVDTNQFYSLQGPTGLPSGSWCQVVWVHCPELGVAELYVDGEQVAVAQTRTPYCPPVFGCFAWLGRTAGDPDRIFCGDYDEFRVYDGALTPAQVRRNYHAGPDAPPDYALALGTPLRLRPGNDTQHFKLTVPSPSSGVVLETSPVLGTNAVWTVVTAPAQVELDGTLSVEIPIGTEAFFRLRLMQ